MDIPERDNYLQMKQIISSLADAVVKMDSESAVKLSRQALEEHVPAEEAIEKGLAKGMERVGELYARGEYFVPEIVVCADALYAGIEVLKSAMPRSAKTKGRVVIGVVEGDTHDIGKNIVVKMLEAAGFEVYDLGNNVPLHEFTRKALEVDADIIALSALVTTTMQHMKTVISHVREASIDRYRYVIVGGAPVSQEYADRIGADGYAEDAPKTVRLICRLMDLEDRAPRLSEYIQGRERRLTFPWTGAAGLRQFGYTMYDIYRDPQKHLRLALEMDRELGADFVYPLDYGRIIVETLGLPLLRPDYDFPSVLDHPVKNKAALEKLIVPDPYVSGPMPDYLEALHLISSSSHKPLALSISGPFTLAVLLVGAEDLARAIIKDPDFVEAVLEFTNEVVGRYAEAVVSMGARFLCVSEPTAVLLSPERFRPLVGDRLRTIYNRLPNEVWKVLHICGNTNYLMQEMIACGAEGLSLDQLMDLPALAPGVPQDVVLIGNLDPIHVLRELGPDEIRRRTIDLLRAMAPYPNYMFSFGCDCANDTPMENLKAAMESARTPFSELG